jgi:hypothetical protein
MHALRKLKVALWDFDVTEIFFFWLHSKSKNV